MCRTFTPEWREVSTVKIWPSCCPECSKQEKSRRMRKVLTGLHKVLCVNWKSRLIFQLLAGLQ